MKPAVICPVHDTVELTEEQYEAAIEHPLVWWCPICGRKATFDIDRAYEQSFNYFSNLLDD